METIEELNAKIMALTTKILDEHPELSKLIDEMPLSIPNESNPEITIQTLNEYYDSLQTMLNKSGKETR